MTTTAMMWDDDERSAAASWGSSSSSSSSRSDGGDSDGDIGAIARGLAEDALEGARTRPAHWAAEEYRDHDFEPRPVKIYYPRPAVR